MITVESPLSKNFKFLKVITLIIRNYINCETCEHPHTVRIGVGKEQHQSYTFPCADCGENISIVLNIDEGLVLQENAIKGTEEGSIINLDSFLLTNPKNIGTDHIKQRVQQVREYLMVQKKYHEDKFGEGTFEHAILSQQEVETVTLNEEWDLFRKCWSLHSRGKEKLSNRIIAQANEEIYYDEPLDDFYDWLWRFCIRLSGNVYDNHFDIAISSITSNCLNNIELRRFADYLRADLFQNHLDIFHQILKRFFLGYSDLNQVYLYCSAGLDIPEGHQASSCDFDSVSSFYGDVFEAFTSMAETLACVNNVMLGRPYTQFEKMDLALYKTIDKANKCNPFVMNEAFTRLTKNVDSQLRNASHHGGFRFEQDSGLIKYRAGKGGIGAENEITYTNYLLKSTNLFLATVCLMRINIALWRFA